MKDKVISEYEKLFGAKPMVVRSPGRINLIGEHIDYNGGTVFPAAIDKAIYLAIEASNASASTIVSLDLNETVQLHSSQTETEEAGNWVNYFLGVLQQLNDCELQVPNFNVVFSGDIPIGSGLSSSAALENGFVFGLNELFDLGLSKVEMVKISQAAEHSAVGVECGIMDQFANMFGQSDQAILLNCDTLEHSYVPIDLGQYELLLINTNVKHQLSDSPYNERKWQCANGFRILKNSFPELSSLAAAEQDQLLKLKAELTEAEWRRCQFVIEEQQRVIATREALRSDDLEQFGELLYQSHKGLKNLYEVSCPELDFLVDLATTHQAVLGARMMGGGFGGCTINLIKQTYTEQFIREVSEAFENEFGHQPLPISVCVSDGTSIVE